jgi:hypothetical protein
LLLGAERKTTIATKYLGFNPDTQEISENNIRHSTDFVDIGGKILIKKVRGKKV